MLPEAPQTLSQLASGPTPYGLYSGPIADVSTTAWADRRRLQRKTWIYAGSFSERYTIGFAIGDAGIVATAFIYIFDAQTGTYAEEKVIAPFGFASGFDPDLRSTWTLRSFSITPAGDTLTCSYQGKRIQIRMVLTENSKGSTTIAPAGDRPFNHTYKNLLMPTVVDATLDGETVRLDGDIGSIDFTKGYPPRHTFWNWASMNATTEHGVAFGVNLVADFNNSIENALWAGGRVWQLSQASFVYSRPIDRHPVQITSLDGTIDMQFTPLGVREEDLNAVLMMSKFKQLFGTFTGTVRLEGILHNFTGRGVVEEHFAKW